jgi:hypothetical protein
MNHLLAPSHRWRCRGDLAPVTLEAHRQILDSVWRPQVGTLSLWAVRYSRLVEVADARRWTKKTYNNPISALLPARPA